MAHCNIVSQLSKCSQVVKHNDIYMFLRGAGHVSHFIRELLGIRFIAIEESLVVFHVAEGIDL